jgi:cobalt/nickel transport system permease protein
VSEPSTATPGWLLQPELGLCPCGCIGTRRKGSFVAKTLDGASSLLRQALFAEDSAAHDGLLQRIEPRVKLVTVLGLLVAVSFVRHVPVLLAMYGATLGLAVASGLSLGFFVKRVWLFIPVFTGVVVLPATLSVITPGHVVLPLGSWFGHPVGVTGQGLTAAGLIVLRVATSISLVVLLTLTTTWHRLLAGLGSLRAPRMFVMVLAMAYRYLFHLLGSVGDMYTARRARTVQPDTDVASGRAFVAASAGALFGKAHALSEEVHLAMVSRGYTGHVRTLDPAPIRARDLGWATVLLAVALLLLRIDHGL